MEFDKYIESIELNDGDGWILASLTDDYYVNTWSKDALKKIDKDKALEIRVFNENIEYKLFRASIDRDFSERTLGDSEAENYYDEIQYLDIDTTKKISEDGIVTTTGGGKYKFPFDNSKKTDGARVKIRYYLGQYEETGQARIEDWRVVEFLEGK